MSAPNIIYPPSSGGGGGISGSGTAGYVAKFTGGTAVGDSLIRDNGTDVAIDSAPAVGYKFTVNGDTTIAGRIDALTGSIDTITSRPSADLVLQREGETAATIKKGSIATVTAATPAATTGNYANLAITATSGSMSGTGATADIVVVGGFVTSVTIRAPGTGYVLGATLTAASLPGLSAGATIATITAVILEIEGAANIMTSGRLAAGTTNGTEQLTVSAGSADRIGMNVVGSVSTLTFGSTNSTGAIRTIAYDRGGAAWTFNYGNNPGPLSTALTIDNSGVASFGGPVRATGTAPTAPAFTGSDTDTGMYFPTANQVRLSTNGTVALAVDASQRVGIGQATPTAPLHVLGTSITAASTTTASAGIHRIEGSASNAIFVGSFSDSPFGMCLQTNSASYPLVLQPAGGNVGIGTTNPGSLLTVNGNLAFNSGYGSAAVAYGTRAWVNFNGTGVVAIRNSGNVSTITDLGVGSYSVNFTTSMPDVNYSAHATVGYNGTVGSGIVASIDRNSAAAAVGSVRVYLFNTTFAVADSTDVFVSVTR